ncbi:MAG TPA: hypothetical protein VGO11_19130 [Chthoniobacteraceae bacterium]|jgi:hypothetical protein|nr:hypothetical protein [Chthoniobacteraceae bacterium]
MWTPSWVVGYHGCDLAVAELVLSGEANLKVSENDYDWLGSGIYFWENDASRAHEWAEFVRDHPQVSAHLIRQPAVIGAVIDLGHCLDLLEAESIRLVRDAYGDLEKVAAEVNLPLPVNAGPKPDYPVRRLDCAVMNYLHVNRQAEGNRPFDSVRAPFTEGALLYLGAGFHSRTHLQLCVRKEAQIIGYFRVRERGGLG